jgi:hypothetical protein
MALGSTQPLTEMSTRNLPKDKGSPARKADNLGRAVVQAVSRWLPTAEARVRVREACGVCCGQSGIGAGFVLVLRFPLPIVPSISPSSCSPGASTIGLLVATVPSGPNWTPPAIRPIFKIAVLPRAYQRGEDDIFAPCYMVRTKEKTTYSYTPIDM